MRSPREAELHYSEGPHRSGPSRRKRRGLEAVQGKLPIPYRQDSSGRLSARWGIVGKISRQRWSRSTSSTPPSQNHLGNTHSSPDPCGMSSMPPNQRKSLRKKRQAYRDLQARNLHPHRLGTGGYAGKQAEWDKEDEAAAESNTPQVLADIPVQRARNWARVKKNSDRTLSFPNPDDQAMYQKIVS